MVLHSIKKAYAKGTSFNTQADAEFEDFKSRLDNLLKALEASTKAVVAAEKDWAKLASDQKKQAENFSTLYPDNDEVRTVAKQTFEAASKVDDTINKASSREEAHVVINRQVHVFIEEIKSVKSEYKKLADAQVEYEMYKGKFESINKSKKKDEEKIARNDVKLKEAQKQYETLLEAVVTGQRKCYEKRGPVFKAAFVSYWLAQKKYLDAFSKDFNAVEVYATQNEKEMMELDVAKLTK